MDNYRKRSQTPARASIDGIMQGPVQPRALRHPLKARAQAFVTPAVPVPKKRLPPLDLALPGPAATSKRYRKAAKKRGRKWWAKRASLALFLMIFIPAELLFGKGFMKVHKVFKGGGMAVALQPHVDPTMLRGEGDGRINILLLGKGGPGHDGPDLTDTMLLASIDPVNNTMSLLSVPRDLWVSAPSGGSSKINAVYANTKYKALAANPHDTEGAEAAGIFAAETTVSQVLGIPMHYYGMVDFTAFKEAVDTVGGVTINAPEELVDPTMAWENSWNPVLAKQGLQTFSGSQALLYVRSRHGSARGDFDRTERQRILITALEQKILSAATYTNPIKISQLLSAFGDHVSTDMSTTDAGRLISVMKAIPGSKISSIGLADPPNNFVTTAAYAGQSIVEPTAGLSNYGAIQSYIRNTLKDGYLLKENASITVLNGTSNPSAATQEAAVLKSYGYNIGLVGNAPTQSSTHTMLIDLTTGKDQYTKHYLEQRLGVPAATKLPANIQPGQAEFVIIVGAR